MAERYWLETLGCPKNQVDSDKLEGTLRRDGYEPAPSPDDADLVVVNTCAFIEAARQESIDTILELATRRHAGARLVVTGCLAERHGDQLTAALPEVDLVAGFGVPVTLGRRVEGTITDAGTITDDRSRGEVPPSFDLLNLPRPAAHAPWAYVKVAEGCDRRCGFCAIPSFRGLQRSRPEDVVLAEVDELGDSVHEVVLVAQDLASWGLDRSATDRVGASGGDASPHRGPGAPAVTTHGDCVRLLYLYPSALDDSLIDAVIATGVPYFDLSLQHVSRPLVQRMRRWGDADKFLERIASIRDRAPDAALRSSFILGYPGETEDDHDLLLSFLAEARLDWAGFFTFSEEPGTFAAGPRRVGARRARSGALARVLGAPGRAHRRAPGRPRGPTDRGARRRARRGPLASRGPRHRRRRPCRSDPRCRGVPQGGGDGGGGAGPVGRVVTEPLRERMRVSTFGPSALKTPANAITVARLLATPVLVVMIVVHGPGWAPFGVALAIGLTDGVDGWLARRQGTDALGRVPRPLGRQGRRGGRAVRGGGEGRGVVAPRRHHRGA